MCTSQAVIHGLNLFIGEITNKQICVNLINLLTNSGM